jgi:hypothetical protein
MLDTEKVTKPWVTKGTLFVFGTKKCFFLIAPSMNDTFDGL